MLEAIKRAALGERTPPMFLFRHFDEDEHVKRLLAGFVWISTLDWCRTCDDARNDADEGKSSWQVTRFDSTVVNDERESKLGNLAKAGIQVDPGGTLELSNATFSKVVPDAYLVCMSESPKLTGFGGHCVRVADPRSFRLAVAWRLAQQFPGGISCRMNPMRYVERRVVDGRPHEEHPAFLGPLGNRREKEWRMCFIPNRAGHCFERFELCVPEVAQLCSIEH